MPYVGNVVLCATLDCLRGSGQGVTFRFGNSGTLKSTFAVFFQRKTGGWIRVEVCGSRARSNPVLVVQFSVEIIESRC